MKKAKKQTVASLRREMTALRLECAQRIKKLELQHAVDESDLRNDVYRLRREVAALTKTNETIRQSMALREAYDEIHCHNADGKLLTLRLGEVRGLIEALSSLAPRTLSDPPTPGVHPL